MRLKYQSFLLSSLFLLAFLLSTIKAQTCQVGVNCDFCCVKKLDGTTACEDNIYECRIVNTREFSGVVVFIFIIAGWCICKQASDY